MRIVERARAGLYPIERAKNIPNAYLTNHCLKGTGSQEGTFIIGKALRERVKFVHANLKTDLSKLGSFDVIFLRNVLIYFDMDTKQHVVSHLVRQLNRGGYLIVGHSESLNGVTNEVSVVVPSVYRKP
jgi:chemotaxis protein methyltransferase CheR